MKNVLILNRGEIALRGIQSSKKLNLKTFVPVNDSDMQSCVASEADKIIHFHDNINPFMSLDIIKNIITSHDIHLLYPGYGFMSEDPRLSKLCSELGVVFIGPNPSALENLSSKIESFNFAKNCNLKTLNLENPTLNDFPVMLKASYGGGGRGNVICEDIASYNNLLKDLKEKSLKLFLNSEILIEKYLPNARHVELQFVATSKKVHFLGTRDCSAQIKFQKFLEEGPSCSDSSKFLEQSYPNIANALLGLGYVGVGTIEFLWDEKSKSAYFLEVNTRIQVEHPVTELLYGVDLVDIQFLIALDNEVNFNFNASKDIKHAICARIYAVDPNSNFSPSPGLIKIFDVPKFLRFDTHYVNSMNVSYNYDPLIGKLVVGAKTRDEAIVKLKEQLARLKIYSGPNNIVFINQFLSEKDYLHNRHDVSYVENVFIKNFDSTLNSFSEAEKDFLWNHTKTLENNADITLSYKSHTYKIFKVDDQLYVFRDKTAYMDILNLNKPFWSEESSDKKNIGSSPITGSVVNILVMDGQIVKKSQPLLVLEAMKTQITIFADDDLTINSVNVQVGEHVKKDQILLGLTYKVN